jgi:hypothetical protein
MDTVSVITNVAKGIPLDITALVVAGIAALVSIFNLFMVFIQTRRTQFINIVTSSRIVWIGNLRKDISNFCALSLFWPAAVLGCRFNDIGNLPINKCQYRY